MAPNEHNNIASQPVGRESPALCFVRVLGSPFLRGPGIKCIVSIFTNFFLLQYRAAFFKGRYPVARADHPLDEKIPFTPRKVNIYLDFVAFWVRVIGFLLRHYGRQGLEPAKELIESIGKLYKKAAGVYGVCFSTTNRPFYLARPRFVIIHATDPHLMCIPSLHVMVVIHTYTLFRELIRRLGGEAQFAPQIEEMRKGALDITEAVLYVKQHSVNCIPAAMYAMTCFDSALFTPEEARGFCAELFLNAPSITKTDGDAIRAHILSLYQRFIAEGEKSEKWETPLLDFLFSLPKAK
ncbi:hypothetical protein [Leadbettera azotonutricia]|uniref:Uncharacterized protein n=1 Tax=Leadbettera azotonutricia (strain ATCC BAA-888 / DSM 13862 / ZAS-9) TaxID=545695 RepID=F5Y784_LEAAZ|nr:hypothetical protein [Leadbettera azotonutricia]AEF81452.1 hypothetical protein TREAZ_1110 [Leadbettera azotonutricia ZAS-9]